MRRRIRRARCSAIALCLTAAACGDGGSDSSVEPAAMLSIVDGWAERNDVTKLAVSMRSPSGSITTVGYSTDGETPDGSTLFIAGSLGKTMMAATTLLLVEDGVLDLDEPIERWLPDFPRADEITMRQLLSHSAGLGNPLTGLGSSQEDFETLQETVTPAQLLAEAAGAVGDAGLPAPYLYSTAGYWTAGSVIESATAQSLAEVMQDRVFRPLGMSDTYLAWPGSVDQQLVGGEMTLPEGTVIPLGTELVPALMSQGWGPGGVLSTTPDLVTFYGDVLDDLLEPASVEAMTTSRADAGGYGLGIDREVWSGERPVWEHSGVAVGYTSAAGVTDDGWSVAVLTNHFDLASSGTDPQPKDLLAELLQHVSAES